MTYQPEHLQLWTRPDSYMGAEWPDYYVFLGQHRDSDPLARSNFECGLEALGGESDTVIVVRARHWAVGWCEFIGVHKNDARALETADSITAALSDYPVLNEDHFSQLEWSEAENYWQQLPIKYRVEMCQEAGVTIFAARHDYIPQQDSGFIFERCASTY
jgi:hypothetical protein